MLECTSKERLKCFYLTKETRDKVLKELECRLGEDDLVSIIEDNDKEVVVCHFGWYKSHYFYNHWYVENYDCEWERYTYNEFREKFELVEE